jgi:hypothetical protein
MLWVFALLALTALLAVAILVGRAYDWREVVAISVRSPIASRRTRRPSRPKTSNSRCGICRGRRPAREAASKASARPTRPPIGARVTELNDQIRALSREAERAHDDTEMARFLGLLDTEQPVEGVETAPTSSRAC